MSDATITILLADDHAVLRVGLRLLLDGRADMTVVGESSDGTKLIQLAEQHNPDVILLDLTMSPLGGLEVLPLLHKKAPRSRVLILTMHDDESYLRQALKAGAAGYVLKKAADTELVSAIHAVTRGEVYIHPAMTRSLVEDIMPDNGNEEDVWAVLSERERDVLQLVALGYTGREIADKLFLSVKSVDTYRARGMEKLGLRNRANLVRFVLARGLME